MSSIVRDWEAGLSASPRASSYDKFHAALVATIIVVGFLVSSLLLIWIAGDGDRPHIAPSLKPIIVAPPDDDDRGDELELDSSGAPNDSEIDTLFESIEEAVSTKAVSSGNGEDGIPAGPRFREPGPPSIKSDSPLKRWQIRYEVAGKEQYKRQLDHFGIEIGVIDGRKDDIWRIGGLSEKGRVAVVASDRMKEQDAAWFSHSKVTLRRWDREIAKDSGLQSSGMLFVQFFPASLMTQIAKLEAEKLEEIGRELGDVKRTTVAFAQTGEQFSISISGFEFH